ncbi:MAG: hypothetical protein HQL08_08750 [Nitrospirae bacterium]|nr:hypothetical protein [Nitrospirota bacterium]
MKPEVYYQFVGVQSFIDFFNHVVYSKHDFRSTMNMGVENLIEEYRTEIKKHQSLIFNDAANKAYEK